ncbi:rCG25646 [Rattus norvegicus]|uniref:RCG25646 n=1 Tax=Rattus norvegicus TaxID=10116 RepID=A6I223_RAT|nr:rCG25646 [Rattus norvegicus]
MCERKNSHPPSLWFLASISTSVLSRTISSCINLVLVFFNVKNLRNVASKQWNSSSGNILSLFSFFFSAFFLTIQIIPQSN